MYRDLDEELKVHRAMSRETAGGLSDRQMGNVSLSQEESWNTWSFLSVERLWQDVRDAARILRKSPIFHHSNARMRTRTGRSCR